MLEITAPVTITLGIVSRNRSAELAQAIASAVAEDFAEIVVVDSGSDPPLTAPANVTLVRREENVACGGGRNVIVEHATGDVVFFLDDDAVLLPGAVERIRQAFSSDALLGAVATHLVRPDGDEARIEQPFRAGFPVPAQDADCGYFIGAGFAVRTSSYRSVGGSDARMQYGADDIELAMRIQQAGHPIRWLHDARVEHRPSAVGRMASATKAGSHVRARVWLARAYFPLPIACSHAGAWIVVTGLEALRARGVREWARWVSEGFRWPVQRRRMTGTQMRGLHRRGGRLFY